MSKIAKLTYPNDEYVYVFARNVLYFEPQLDHNGTPNNYTMITMIGETIITVKETPEEVNQLLTNN